MPLPAFSNNGDLPEGIYQATIDEIVNRFGHRTLQRQNVTKRLTRIYSIAKATDNLERFIIFGSYVTTKPDPNDIDIVLVMSDDFNINDCDEQTRKLLNHMEASVEFGASVFWIRPSMIILETLEEFVAHWQIKRDRTRRGIVEVKG